MKSAINLWANFLANEKLTPQSIGEVNTLIIMELCQKMATVRRPNIKMHKDKIESRRFVINTAMDMNIDLMSIKKKNGKPAMGRGLLDIWNEEYEKRFGSKLGTLGEAEDIRRKIITKNSQDS